MASRVTSPSPRWIGWGLLSLYVVIRLLFDSFWRQVSPYYAYAFEVLFVMIAYGAYRQRVSFKCPRPASLGMTLVFSFVGGAIIYKLAVFSGIEIPFDFEDRETLLFLLIVGPILEEFIFRMALWQPLKDLLKKNSYVLIITTLLFSAGHLLALWSVPVDFGFNLGFYLASL